MKRDVVVELKQLRLNGMAGAWADLVEQSESGGAGLGAAGGAQGSRWLLEHLLQAEAADRALRSVSHQMHAAKFPLHRDLACFNFDGTEVDRKLILQLTEAKFTESSHNIVLVGGPGTGKTLAVERESGHCHRRGRHHQAWPACAFLLDG